ncbi:MAG TPA: FAD-dependent oxidoreductase [Stellaceae bacterium]|nr:FAD-dependent oxidoreductase [Stellaceae bacterium]
MTPKSSDYGRVFFQAEVFRAGRLAERRPRPSDTIIERARRVPVFRDCDVLVAGGGPAGTAAAIAAARAGADTVLVERHNHLGGLSTGGLVIWIDRMTDWSGRRVIEGIAAELIHQGRWQARRAPTGAAPTRRPPPIGRNEPRPFIASSPGRQRSIRRT